MLICTGIRADRKRDLEERNHFYALTFAFSDELVRVRSDRMIEIWPDLKKVLPATLASFSAKHGFAA